MLRITTSGVMRTYKSNLMRSSNQLYDARNKVLTQRNFNSYAEDPAAATQAFKMRRIFSRTSDQLSNNTSLISRFESASTAIASTKNLVEEAANDAGLRSISDPTASGRQPLGEVLSSTAESIVQALNVQYADSFIFAGNDALNPPFSWGDNGNLLFRGISVNSGGVGVRPEGTPPNPAEVASGSEWDQYYTDNPDFKKLAQMSYETAYIDIGNGLSEDSNGDIDSASAFNSAISGINILSFGLDEDGDPKNAVSIIKELSDILKRCDSESGAYANDEDKVAATCLTDKLQKALSSITNKWTSMDAEAQYLKSNEERLTEYSNSINEQILGLEQADLADAITDFSWAQYCYNSALKVGNSILSQSLIDYMN